MHGRLDRGEPAAAAVRRRRGGGARARLGALRRATGARASSGRSPWPLALFVGWSGLSLLWSKDVAAGRDLPALLRPAVRAARRRARAAAVARRLGAALYVQLARDGARVRRDRRSCQYLTRNIFWNPKVKSTTRTRRAAGSTGSTRSSTTRRSTAASSSSRSSRASCSCSARRGDSPWAVAAALASRSPGSGSLPSFSQSSFVALRAAIVVAPSSLWRRRAVCLLAVAVVALLVVGRSASPQIAPPHARQGGRSRTRRAAARSSSRTASSSRVAPSGGRRRRRRLRARATRISTHLQGQGAEGGRVAHDADHGRRRDRRARARCSSPGSSARRSSLPFRRQSGRRLRRARPARVRTSLDRDPRAQPLLQRAVRGPALLGPARARRGRRARAEASRRDRRRRSARSCSRRTPTTASSAAAARWRGSSRRAPRCATSRSRSRPARCRRASRRTRSRARCARRPPSSASREANLTVHDFDVRTFPDHRQEILELLIELWNDWQPDVVFQPSLHDIHQDHQTIAAGRAARVQAHDDPRLRDPVEQLRLRLPGVHLAREAARRAQGGSAREVRLAAAPPLRERRVRLEPRAHARHQREPRVRRGVPGVPRRQLTTIDRAPASRRSREEARRRSRAFAGSPCSAPTAARGACASRGSPSR